MDAEQKAHVEKIFYEIKTEEQAVNYVRELLDQARKARKNTDAAVKVRVQKKANSDLLIRYGRALGALTTLMHCRKISVEGYNKLVIQVHAVMVPSVIEAASIFSGGPYADRR